MIPEAPAIRLSVLGPAQLVRGDGAPVRSVLAQPKRVALLAFLRCSEGGRAVTRDAVLGTFWPELPEERALGALRQSVHFLRRSLGAEAIEREADHLLSIPPARVDCDVEAFETAVQEGRLEDALTLYRGPFLDGTPVDGAHALEDWIERSRRRLHGMAVRAAHELAERALADGKPVAAVEWARRALDLDPLEEAGVAVLVEAHARAGEPVAAVRAYEAYTALLTRELDLEPSAELCARIREVKEGGPPAEMPRPAPSPPEPSPRTPSEPTRSHPTPSEPGPPEPGPLPNRRRSAPPGIHGRPRALVAAATSLVVAIALATRVVASGAEPSESDGARGVDVRPSLAVLPFTNLSPDTANAYFAAGIHESLLFNLSRIGSIDVTALRAVRGYAGSDLPPSEIARRLDVRTLMSGSVQREGDRIRIIVELVEPGSGTQLWSEVYDRRLGDVFSVQTEIARSVAGSLRTVLTPSEEDRIARHPTESLEALDHFMQARARYTAFTQEGMDGAIVAYGRAVEADPAFAAAWAGLADAHLQRVQFFGFGPEWVDSARVLADRAVELDPDLPEAHKTLGFLHSIKGRDRAALASIDRALDLRPAYADALNNAGWSRYLLGEVAEAERLIRRSFRLQPTVPQLRSNMGAILAALGRHEEAENWLDGVLEQDPAFTATRTWRTYVDLDRGDPDAALARAERYLEDEPSEGTALARAAYAALLARDYDLAGARARRAIDSAPGADLFDMRRVETILGAALLGAGDDVGARDWAARARDAEAARIADGADGWDPRWEMAAARAVAGDDEAALEHLEAAVEEGLPLATLLRLDPSFDALRSDPRFVALSERVLAHSEAQRSLSLSGG